MKTYRNITYINGREKFGRRLSMVGLIILFIGLASSFVPNFYPPGEEAPNQFAAFLQQYWAYISFVALPAGFVFASFGSYYINKFARRRWPDSKQIARPDEVFERSMKGFDNKFTYFSYSLPVPYVLVGPSGILLFSIRSDKGRVVASGEKWKEPFSLGRIFTVFAREGVGSPVLDHRENERKMRELLAEADESLQHEFAEIPIDGAAVFLNSQVELEIDGPEIDALRADQVKQFVRNKVRDVKLKPATLREVTAYLVGVSDYQQEAEES
jgi:hypothetical protein